MSATLGGIVLDCPDPGALADFYRSLLEWTEVWRADDWVQLRGPDGRPVLSFAPEPAYVRPAWPAEPGAQQMQLHLDLLVDDLELDTERAIELGATLAGFQPQDDVRVLFDPAGHPFCLFVDGA